MKYMRVKHEIVFPDQSLLAGTILPVEDEPNSIGLLYILGGKFAYRSIHIDHLKEVQIAEFFEELEDRRNQAASFQRCQEQFLTDLADAGLTISGLRKELESAHEEIAMLLQQIERSIDDQKAYLPFEKDKAAATLSEVKALVETWWRGVPRSYGSPHTQILTETICDYIQKRDGLPF